MRATVIAVASALVAACAGAPASTSQGSQPDQLYRQKCSSCHRLYDPSSRTRAEWEAAMARMAPKAHLSPEQEGMLRHWLEARASDAGTVR